jgi:hypothetical protein
MIISHSKKFIFIHIYKVAGTSIQFSLNRYAYFNTKKNQLLSGLKIYPKIFTSDFSGHSTALQVQQNIPTSIYRQYYKFAFVRNPWDWQVSLYHYAQQTKDHFQHKMTSKMSFNEYIEWRVNEDLHLQVDFVQNENGEIIVDYIGKMENLQMDFDTICKKIKVPKIILPQMQKSLHTDFRSYYSSDTIELVKKAFKKDIELFDYSFE